MSVIKKLIRLQKIALQLEQSMKEHQAEAERYREAMEKAMLDVYQTLNQIDSENTSREKPRSKKNCVIANGSAVQKLMHDAKKKKGR